MGRPDCEREADAREVTAELLGYEEGWIRREPTTETDHRSTSRRSSNVSSGKLWPPGAVLFMLLFLPVAANANPITLTTTDMMIETTGSLLAGAAEILLVTCLLVRLHSMRWIRTLFSIAILNVFTLTLAILLAEAVWDLRLGSLLGLSDDVLAVFVGAIGISIEADAIRRMSHARRLSRSTGEGLEWRRCWYVACGGNVTSFILYLAASHLTDWLIYKRHEVII
jgi:hypothetical protein